ncbi:MAG TPA: septation protein A [Gammaproteobacteria bacterium]|nr:septation protein A [Gammaproteobacteria bacterium]
MNNFLLDLFPVLLFFIAFKYYGIYAATWVGIITTLFQTLISRLINKKWDKMQVITLIIFVIFGGMTLYLHNPIFVKWKPSIIFWIFTLVLMGSHFIGSKPLIQRLVEGSMNAQNPTKIISLPARVGKMLNVAWMIFFAVLGGANLYIAYTFDDSVWVNFKLYGITTVTIIFSILQTIYLVKYIKPHE